MNEIKYMDKEDIAKLLQVFDRENPKLDDLLTADSQRIKKNRQRNIKSLHDGIYPNNHEDEYWADIMDMEHFGDIPNNKDKQLK